MIKDAITYLNTQVETLGYFNEQYCLVDRIEREGKIYPAIYNGNNEYVQINLDYPGSLMYWRKNGAVDFSSSPSTTSIGTDYSARIPLKLVGFVKKEDAHNDQYFADNLCLAIISKATVSNSALKAAFKAKRVTVTATRYETEGRDVAAAEYDGIAYEPRYTHAYFSIDFELNIITNSQCYDSICN